MSDQDEHNPDNTKMIHAVRQVMINDLGLTRESIREEMQNIIDDTVERRANHLLTHIDNTLEKIVKKELNMLVRSDGPPWPPASIGNLVTEEARKQVAEFVMQNLRITAVE